MVTKRAPVAAEEPRPRRRRGIKVRTLDTAEFAERLNRLFDAVYPPLRGPYLGREVVHDLWRRGFTLSTPYLSQLRSGKREQPSMETIEMIADFFGVRSDYLIGSNDVYQAGVDKDLYWFNVARDPKVRRVVSALLELSDESREELLSAAEAAGDDRHDGPSETVQSDIQVQQMRQVKLPADRGPGRIPRSVAG